MLQSLVLARPELAIFFALIVGYAIGAIKVGPFQLGGVAGTLLAALVIGQIRQFRFPLQPNLSASFGNVAEQTPRDHLPAPDCGGAIRHDCASVRRCQSV